MSDFNVPPRHSCCSVWDLFWKNRAKNLPPLLFWHISRRLSHWSFSFLIGQMHWFSTCYFTGVLDPIHTQLERYMDLLAARQKIVASNIANADTPGYKTRDIDFQFEFMSLVKGASPTVSEVSELPAKNDGNNVSIDREARLLAENAIRFNLATSLMRSQLALIRSAIQEDRNG